MENFPIPENKIETQKKQFQEELQKVLNTQITTENINDFADKALDNLINLNDEILESYPKNKNSELKKKELEDTAYDFYEMEGIENLLDRIQEKAEQIDDIKNFIKEKAKQDPKVFVKPDKKKIFDKAKGDITWEKKKLIPRLTTLLYLLETDFEIPKEEVNVTEGQVLNTQMRREPYFRVEIDGLEKTVYICIEEGNVTYIFDNNKLKEYEIKIDDLDVLTKEERKELLLSKKDIGTKIRQSKNWREKMTDLLLADELSYEENKTEKTAEPILDLKEKENLPQVSKDKNDEWYGFWTDENGDHWGNREALSNKIGISISKYKIIKIKYGNKWKTKKHPTIAHSYEEIITYENLQEIHDSPKAAKKDNSNKNEWKYFYTDKRKKHWGPIKPIGNRLSNTEGIKVNNNTLRTKIKENTYLKTKKIVGYNGAITTAYIYEEVKNLKFITEAEYIPQVSLKDNENEWKGFFKKEKNKHIGSISKISTTIHIDSNTINKYIKKYTFKAKDIKDEYGHNRDGYIYEDITKIPEIKALIKNPKTQARYRKKQFVKIESDHSTKDMPHVLNDKSNKWHGFWTDENGIHWSSTNLISKKIGCSRNKLNKILLDTKHEKRIIKGLNNKRTIAYSYKFLDKHLNK